MSETNAEAFRGGPGKVHPKQRRSAGLPSDCECVACGAVIPDGDACFQLRKGINSLGAFDPLQTTDATVVCVDCGEGVK